MVKVKNLLRQKIIINLIYALITIIYFIVFATQYTKMEQITLNKYMNISTIVFLVLSILMMEIGYRKDNKYTFFNGIEFLAISVFILLTQHMCRILNSSIQIYTLTGANFLAVYYILKSAILYTKEQQDRLNNLSDIKEIVKNEPTKKETKRKNVINQKSEV